MIQAATRLFPGQSPVADRRAAEIEKAHLADLREKGIAVDSLGRVRNCLDQTVPMGRVRLTVLAPGSGFAHGDYTGALLLRATPKAYLFELPSKDRIWIPRKACTPRRQIDDLIFDSRTGDYVEDEKYSQLLQAFMATRERGQKEEALRAA